MLSFFAGCEPAQLAPKQSSDEAASPALIRMIIDDQGRTIRARVIKRESDSVTLLKLPENTQYVSLSVV